MYKREQAAVFILPLNNKCVYWILHSFEFKTDVQSAILSGAVTHFIFFLSDKQ